jgi:hypothetical protein
VGRREAEKIVSVAWGGGVGSSGGVSVEMTVVSLLPSLLSPLSSSDVDDAEEKNPN